MRVTISLLLAGAEDEGSFECASAGLFADVASGCERFHLCESGASSPLSSFRCPGDQLFNQRLGACDAADLVDCGLLSRPEHEFRRDRGRGRSRRRRSTPILVSVDAQPTDSVQFYLADYEDAVPVDFRRPQRQPKATKPPLYEDADYEEGGAAPTPAPGASTSSPPAKSVSYYVYAAKDDAQAPTATRPPNSAVPEDYVDDNYEAQSHPQTPLPIHEKFMNNLKTLMDFVDDYDDLAHGLTKPTTKGAPVLTSPSPADKPVAAKVLDEYDYVANDYDDSTKGDVVPKDKSSADDARPSQIDEAKLREATSGTPSAQTTTTAPTTTSASTTTDAASTQAKPHRGRKPTHRRPSPSAPPARKTLNRSRPTPAPEDASSENAVEAQALFSAAVDTTLTSSSLVPLSERPSTVAMLETPVSYPSASPAPFSVASSTSPPSEPSTATTAEMTTYGAPSPTTSPASATVPAGPFVCTGREMNKFHRDDNNCRMFHYCTPGFTARQVLDFRFECVDGTSYDEVENRCQVPVSGPCAS